MITLFSLFEQDHYQRINIKPGLKVDIVLKKDQSTGKLTTGVVKDILTSKGTHTRGIKVRLVDGQVGRVQKIYTNKQKENIRPIEEKQKESTITSFADFKFDI